jgi:uncharacterized protein
MKMFLHTVNSAGEGALIALIKGYRYGIRPMLGQRCRFFPSCSEYALEAIATHGAAKGAYLSGKRLLKCQPWHDGGLDPVPEKKVNQRRDPATNA